jgi:hypothetical protein
MHSKKSDSHTPAPPQRYADLRGRNERRAKLARVLQAQRMYREERVVQVARQRRFSGSS